MSACSSIYNNQKNDDSCIQRQVDAIDPNPNLGNRIMLEASVLRLIKRNNAQNQSYKRHNHDTDNQPYDAHSLAGILGDRSLDWLRIRLIRLLSRGHRRPGVWWLLVGVHELCPLLIAYHYPNFHAFV